MTFELPRLPFDPDALEPAMSARTLELHHGKHHAGYVSKLNDLVADTPYAEKALEDIVREAADDADKRALFNNAGQAWNHAFFWNSLSPDGGGAPVGELGGLIERDFGSFAGFKDAFVAAGVGQFGSGWAWLVLDGDRLRVAGTPNARPAFLDGGHPLLVCDVWEHAYYVDWQNRRQAYLEAFVEELANWEFAAAGLERHGAGGRAGREEAGRPESRGGA